MKPSDFSKQDYVDFMNFSMKYNPTPFHAFKRFMFDKVSQELQYALDQEQATSKKYYAYIREMIKTKRDYGIDVAEKMIGKCDILETNMKYWDAEVERLEKLQDQLSGKWEVG